MGFTLAIEIIAKIKKSLFNGSFQFRVEPDYCQKNQTLKLRGRYPFSYPYFRNRI